MEGVEEFFVEVEVEDKLVKDDSKYLILLLA